MNASLGRVQKAIDIIEADLLKPIDLDQVAEIAQYSPYHFHRMCIAVLGESLAEYIRKRRLAIGADLLLRTERPVIDIALECQFETQESFTRAFKKMFTVPPGRFRETQPPFSFKRPASLDLMRHLKEGKIDMEPKYVERKEIRAIGMGGSFAPHDQEMANLWQKFIARMPEVQAAPSKESYGVCLAKHDQIPLKDKDQFVYVAALPVAENAPVPEGMVEVKIPACRYAVFTHKGPIQEIHHTINYIWGTWLPKGKVRRADRPDFELYDERFKPETLDGEVDIYIPVEN